MLLLSLSMQMKESDPQYVHCLRPQGHHVPDGMRFCIHCGLVLHKRPKPLGSNGTRPIDARGVRYISRSLSVLCAAQDNCCYFCEKKFGKDRKPSREHLMPKSRGGGNGPDNVVAACTTCNHSKGDMTEAEYAASTKSPKVFRDRYARQRSEGSDTLPA